MKNKTLLTLAFVLFISLSFFHFKSVPSLTASEKPSGASASSETSLLSPADLQVTPAKGFIEDTLAVTIATSETGLAAATAEAAVAGAKISLYEFGAGKCVQCKNMKPIIEGLQKELEGKVEVKMFDVGADKEITEKHKIMLIPCQVFLDGEGKELFRHEGFYEKEEIVNKLKELGAKL
ncbi:MAG TPA: thioredoxin family protein [Candidatus Wallbacteria bacterium]|nr:thioredoxin family protein [Candidatus Wallbacteria bacterium]